MTPPRAELDCEPKALVNIEYKVPEKLIGGSLGKGHSDVRELMAQAYHMSKKGDNPRFIRISETALFEILPVIRSCFDAKIRGAFNNKNAICYDPEKTAKPRRWHEWDIYSIAHLCKYLALYTKLRLTLFSNNV
ncbi:hypothetical protein SBOR_8991 [Sclerotinia borealis F-4128]|uniref:Uncharacterized protein n=1 Tax=Sclerotinia borealis (strain F-4128) TaxID=1432307 RepID=W9C4H5_SCLBF|nr:hypothetical protein SBOR_8991 [Sclerotinia borealis F-4128]